MNLLMYAALFAEENTEDMKNVTPDVLLFLGKFVVVFGLIALIAVLTPKIAAWVDKTREKTKEINPVDPRLMQVRSPYDLPPVPPQSEDENESDAD